MFVSNEKKIARLLQCAMHVVNGATATRQLFSMCLLDNKRENKGALVSKMSVSYEDWTEGDWLLAQHLNAFKAYACVLTLRNTCTTHRERELLATHW